MDRISPDGRSGGAVNPAHGHDLAEVGQSKSPFQARDNPLECPTGSAARAALIWARRQPDITRRFAAMTAYCALNCIAAGWSSEKTMDALADNVAKMKGDAP